MPPPSRPTLYARPGDLLAEHPLVGLSLAALGASLLTWHVIRLVRVLLQTFLIPGIPLRKFGAKKGAWAVVTGATDGIGKEFALQLGKAGFNVLLVSRSPEKLGAVAGEIESKYGVKTKTHAIDFSKNDAASYAGLEAALQGLTVGVLVNNVGKGYDMPTNFADHALSDDEALLAINITSHIRITHLVLPHMLSPSPAGPPQRALILNIGSFSGAYPSPMLSVYSASKSFLQTFSQCLSTELASSSQTKHITVSLLNAHFVVSNLSKIRRANVLAPTARAFVASALRKVGVACGSVGRPGVSSPYWSHALLDWLLGNYVPSWWLLGYVNDMHKDIRRRALRKQERLAAQSKKE